MDWHNSKESGSDRDWAGNDGNISRGNGWTSYGDS